jgi:hypothetical protein
VEFRAEVRELCAMLDAAFPRKQQVPAGSKVFEDRRRSVLNLLRALPVKDRSLLKPSNPLTSDPSTR